MGIFSCPLLKETTFIPVYWLFAWVSDKPWVIVGFITSFVIPSFWHLEMLSFFRNHLFPLSSVLFSLHFLSFPSTTSLSFTLSISHFVQILSCERGVAVLRILCYWLFQLILTRLIQYNPNIYSCRQPLPFPIHSIHSFKFPLPKQYH